MPKPTALFVFVAFFPALALAGPVDPPAGPVASTHKTLTQIEPRTPIGPETTPGATDCVYLITEPGSYYLTENLAGQPGKHGIKVLAGNVTLDLAGFSLVGDQTSLDGIHTTFTARNLNVRDGTFIAWDEGVDALSSNGGRFERLLLDSNRGTGLVAGNSSAIIDCIARHSGADGFFCDNFATITRSTANSNSETGIILFGAATAIDCAVGGNNLHGISTGARCLVRGNHCTLNGNNTESAGIYVTGQFTRVEGNSVVQNGVGVQVVGTRNIIIQNSAALNGGNFVIAVSNTAGPVTSDLSTAGPWANIAH